MRSMKSMGLFATMLAALSVQGQGAPYNGNETPEGPRMRFMNHANPIFFGKSQKAKKSNKLRLSHNAKLKRRKSC